SLLVGWAKARLARRAHQRRWDVGTAPAAPLPTLRNSESRVRRGAPMSKLRLTIASGDYDIIRPLKEGLAAAGIDKSVRRLSARLLFAIRYWLFASGRKH